MEAVRQLVAGHLAKYPGMEPDDVLKLLYQSAMGGEHLMEDEADFARAITDEMALPGVVTADPPAPEPIGGGLCRVHLSSVYKGPSPRVLARLCGLSARRPAAGGEALRKMLAALREMDDASVLPWPRGTAAARVDRYLAEGCPALRHSGRFRRLYRPHYRLLAADMALHLPVFAAVDGAMGQRPHVLCAIDGMSAAGKSSLAALLADVYGCGVVHCDDFFLRPGQRTAERLAEPGGNIDYERLAPVAAMAADDRAFAYEAFNCQTMQMETRRVPAGPLTVLEGAYALHPGVAARCDVKVFLSVDAALQRRRVVLRCGAELARRFECEWIPMENSYFGAFGVRGGADVVVDTTPLG